MMRLTIVCRVLTIIDYVVSVGMTIFMTWQFVTESNKMKPVARIFEGTNVASACLEGLFAVVMTRRVNHAA